MFSVPNSVSLTHEINVGLDNANTTWPSSKLPEDESCGEPEMTSVFLMGVSTRMLCMFVGWSNGVLK